MDRDRWNEMETLLSQVLARPEAERPGFLATACAGDEALRAEMESLLGAHEEAAAYFGGLAEIIHQPPPERERDPYHLVGQVVSHYRIQAVLGGGGMGIVYRAEDTRLRRPVALKFLPPAMSRDGQAKQRFLYEAQAASALDHPNICTIYEIGEDAEGRLFIAMACYDGPTLKEKMADAPLPVDEALGITRQIAAGLACAHARGIIHRDVKPANVIFSADGTVRILDFGVAKLSHVSDITKTGTTLGTVSYISPEQVRGDEVDPRTDVWSLGVVLFEMLTGQRPFAGPFEAAVIYSVIHDAPPPLSRFREDVPAAVDQLCRQALSKDPARRLADMAALLAALDALQGRDTPAPGLPVSRPPVASIAVLPFLNLSPDPDNAYFCDGLAEELINALTHISGLHVAARTSSFAFKDRRDDIKAIGARLQVDTVLEGSVRKAGNRLRIMAQLIDVADGYQRWSKRYNRVLDDVFAIQDEIALAIVDELRLKLVRGEKKALVRRATDDVEAYALYLRGRQHWNRRTPDGLQRAVALFEEALARDPAFASAHAGLADCHTMMGFYGYLPGRDVYPLARAAARKALDLDDGQAEAYSAMGAVRALYDHDWAGAEVAFQQALDRNTSYATAHLLYAMMVLAPTRRLEEALAHMRHARRLDPVSPVLNAVLAYHHWAHREYERALDVAQQALVLTTDFFFTYTAVGVIFEQQGRLDEALAAFRRAEALAPGNTRVLGMLGHAHGLAGDAAAARAVLADLDARAGAQYVSAFDRALVYMGLGETDAVFDWLGRACDERSDWIPFLTIEPRWDPLRSDPRFDALLERLHLAA